MFNNQKALRFVGSVCRWVYRRMDHIVVLSPGFKRLLIQRGVPDRKVSVIYNWADEASLRAPVAMAPPLLTHNNQFCILFAGNMGKGQALDTVIDAASLLQQRGSRVRWVMLGGGVEVARLKSEAMSRQLKNIQFLDPVPMAEVGAYLSAADALLVHLKKDPLFEITIPSKTQAYMAVGRPLLMAVDGDAADLVRQSGGGVVAESENPEDLACAAEKLAAMSSGLLTTMGANAQRFYRENLGLKEGVRKFGQVFKQHFNDECEIDK
jgi:glycosyltransferase involved in cell wall biosynthesis